MPDTDRIPDALILAAAKRAGIHQGRRDEGVTLSQIKAHLALPHNGWTTRQIQPQLDRMEAAGLIVREWLHSHTLWSVTPQGRRQASPFRELPESRQHRAWREARDLAAGRIDEFRDHLRGALAEATAALDVTALDSDAWFEMSERLQHASWRLASATYCLNEWQEPSDAHADEDPSRRVSTRMGRRNPKNWDKR